MKKTVFILMFLFMKMVSYGQTDSTLKYTSVDDLSKSLSKISTDCYDSRIVVIFVIDTIGQIQNLKFNPRACNEKTEKEIIKAIKLLPFKPYIKDGKPINVEMRIPVSF